MPVIAARGLIRAFGILNEIFPNLYRKIKYLALLSRAPM